MDEELQAQVEEVAARTEERLADISQRQQLANKVTATARSRDGMVTVEVGAHGQLLDVMLDPGVFERTSPHRLAIALKDLARKAAADAAARVQEILAPVLPPGGVPEDGDFTKVIPTWTEWASRLR